MLLKHLLLSVSLTALLVTPALAADIPSSSNIDKVTIFPRGAELTRLAEVTLEPGAHTLIFPDLPDRVVANSIRVEAFGLDGLSINSLDTRRIFVDGSRLNQDEHKRIKDEIEKLGDAHEQLDATIRTANTQLTLLQNLSTLPTVAPASGAGAAPAQPNWINILTLIGSMDDVQAKVLAAKQQQRDITRKIEKLEKQLSLHKPKRDARTEVKVHVNAAGAGKANLRIRYQVRNGGWQPFYDLRLTTGSKEVKPGLEIIRRASIAQRTGEDWTNVTVELSTTRPQQGTSAPELRPSLVRFRQPIIAYKNNNIQKRRMFKNQDMMMAEAPAPAPMAAGRAVAAKPALEQAAVVESYAFQAVFKIPGRVSVQANGNAKKVRIDAATPDLDLNVRAAPSRDSTAYLYAHVTWNGKTGLLPGRASLYRDGAFAGSGFLPLVNPGDKHEIGFGADDKVKVKRVQLNRAKSVTGLLTSSRVDERDYQITVTNMHAQKMPITIHDQIPYSEDEEIVVNMLAKTTPPTAKNLKDKRGIMAWNFDLAPGAEKNIRLNYQITWPKKKTIEFVGR